VLLRSGKNEPAAGRGGGHHLRPQRADRARHRQPLAKADRGVHRRGAGLRAVFLWHLRSALVAIISLPLGILMAAFIVMRWQGINANIMSLGGIAIAIGAMVDAAVVMIENAHKKLEAWQHAHPGESLGRRGALARHHRRRRRGRPGAVLLAADHHAELHPGVHAGGAGGAAVRPAGLHQDLCDGGRRRLSVTLIPVLMGYWIRGRIPDEQSATRSTAG
jgi:Cu(I)/Ag(I) efflux system membrane protein CusA/SilA